VSFGLKNYFGVNGIKNPSNGVWGFRDAYRFLFKRLAEDFSGKEIRGELPAIISHWLHDMKNDPILFKGGSGKRWLSWMTKEGDGTKPKIDFSEYPLVSSNNRSFRFIDLFAGIGGFRIGLQENGGKCVFSCEWDPKAKETYLQNYAEIPFGDIRFFTNESRSDEFIDKNIPDHDVLAAGFPCQPFSLAGVSARASLGKKHGFFCKVQGTLFFDIVRIASVKRPKVLFLENVKNLVSHDGGKTFNTIKEIIENHLGYSFFASVIDSCTLVPQRRKRIYMVCLRDPRTPFSFPDFSGTPLILKSILERNPHPRYNLSERMWEGHKKRTLRNISRGTGFTAFLADVRKPANTLVARYYKDGKECLIPTKTGTPRMLTVGEAAHLQGFKLPFKPHPSRSSAYKQFGNSVTVPVVTRLGKAIKESLPQVS
jgi:DNA (cytosine-5)-methyltransferase 1